MHLRVLGSRPGPTMQGIETFVLLFGLIDGDGAQAVHTYENGESVLLQISTYPIPKDSPTAIALKGRNPGTLAIVN